MGTHSDRRMPVACLREPSPYYMLSGESISSLSAFKSLMRAGRIEDPVRGSPCASRATTHSRHTLIASQALSSARDELSGAAACLDCSAAGRAET